MSLLRSYLEANAILTPADLEAAARHQQAQGGSLDTALLELGMLTAADLDLHLGKACGLPTVPARLLETGPTRPWGHVPKALLDIGWVLPLALEDGLVLTAVHPDLPDARLGQLYRQIRGFTPMVTPECCLAKLAAERTGGIVAPRHAMLVLDVLDALSARETTPGAPGTTLVGVPVALPVNAPAAPAPIAHTIPYAAARAHDPDGPAGPPTPARPAAVPSPALYLSAPTLPSPADSLSATVAEPVFEDSSADAAGDSFTAAATITRPVSTAHDPASSGTFPVPRQDSGAYVAAGSGSFPDLRDVGRTTSPRSTRATSAPQTAAVPQDSRTTSAPVPQDSRTTSAPVPQDSRTTSAPVPQDSRPSSAPLTAPVVPDRRSGPLPRATDAHPAPARPDSRPIPAPVLQDSRPADPASAQETRVDGPITPTSRSHPRSGGSNPRAAAPLPQLPLAQRLAPARAALGQARERDRITESLVRAAIQVAPRVALFGVKREGLRALAAPGSSLHLPRSLVIPIPDGSLLDRAVAGEIRLRLLTEPQLAFAVGRPLGIPCILEPVYAQNRCVLMLYIDRSGAPFELSEQGAVRDLCDVARSSLEALLRIMGLGNGARGDSSLINMRVDAVVEPTQPAPPDPSSPGPVDANAYVAPPEPAPPVNAWASPPATPASVTPAQTADVFVPPADATPAPPVDDPIATADEPPVLPAAPIRPIDEPSPPPARPTDMDGVPELTRRPRRPVIALVNPIRRDPPASEGSRRAWVAATDTYTSPETPQPASEPPAAARPAAESPSAASPAAEPSASPSAEPSASPSAEPSAAEPPAAYPTAAASSAADITPASASPPTDSAPPTADAPSKPTEADAPVQSDPHAPTRRLPTATLSVLPDSSAATASPVLSDSPAALPTAPAASDAPAAPVPTDSPDPSASTSGLHMPNLVAPPGNRRAGGKRGDRTRPAASDAVLVIPGDLRRPESRAADTKPADPVPTLSIPASLIAPAPLPGTKRRGKGPQHPTPPRAEDITLNMPRLVRMPTIPPPEPAAAQPVDPPADAAPADLSLQPAAPVPDDLSPQPAAPVPDDLSAKPADATPPTAPEPAAPAPAPAPQIEPDDAIAAYLQHPDDPAALQLLRDLGDPVFVRMAVRFPGPIDPRSASDVRSFPPPGVHGPLLRACVEIGEPLTPHILELIDHPRPQIRFYAAFLFQELRDPRCLRSLAAHAFDPDPDVRLIATRVLESYSRVPGFVGATEQVRAALTGRDRDRALLATEAAGTLRDTRAVPLLIDLLSVRDKQIRETALEALCSITAKHHGYRPAKWKAWYADHGEQPRVLWVMDALKHRDPAVRRWAADELLRVTGHRIPPPQDGEKITPRYVLRAWETWWDQHGAEFP